ncbi:DUF3310 domain-containing protein [Paenibacillus polymyxa]|uniref:DUF3310 domain-containing protein n=1 Tax=Paenibacillus polymyxa TaxID=1406 RepID=UPI00129B50A5|nr:DUF3310 domain-containing protein [Paenibacillus polymyxa]
MSDAIRPSHYSFGGIEPIDFMHAKMSPVAYRGFLAGNVIKYISRYEHKNGLEDLKKARYYLDRLITDSEESKDGSKQRLHTTED